ncbi:unnamed protein product, partial [Meganyctiphanes norvegica]
RNQTLFNVLVATAFMLCIGYVSQHSLYRSTEFSTVTKNQLYNSRKPDLEERFKQRLQHLKEGCRNISLGSDVTGSWYWNEIVKRHHPVNIGFDTTLRKHGIKTFAKAGSTWWRKHLKALTNQRVIAKEKVYMIQVRHPLLRLFSVYTDKFLGGKPISVYTESYGIKTESLQTFEYRWYSYWLPALISTGRFKPHHEFFDAVMEAKETIMSPPVLKNIMESLYGSQEMELRTQFVNATFTFPEFLNHIIWTYDVAIADKHWVPQAIETNVCQHDYSYVVKLETFDEDIPFVLQHLGYKIPYLKKIHSTSNEVKHSTEKYYRDVSKEIVKRIISLYENDFKLFLYDKGLNVIK